LSLFSISPQSVIMSLVIGGFLESGWCSQPDPTGEPPMTTAKPLARYRAIGGALASGLATASYTTSGDATKTKQATRAGNRPVPFRRRERD
jgi:hypothetical protein